MSMWSFFSLIYFTLEVSEGTDNFSAYVGTFSFCCVIVLPFPLSPQVQNK